MVLSTMKIVLKAVHAIEIAHYMITLSILLDLLLTPVRVTLVSNGTNLKLSARFSVKAHMIMHQLHQPLVIVLE